MVWTHYIRKVFYSTNLGMNKTKVMGKEYVI